MAREYPIYFVSTPIGNLADITLRAIDCLKNVDLILCEDTRHTIRLLKHLEIEKPLLSFNAQSEERKIPEVIQKLKDGLTIAVVSDAGMPAVSDPGQRLVQTLLSEDIEYTILPGPSAVLTALVGSGFPAHNFSFGGFLPIKKGKKKSLFEAAIESEQTNLFFESPHRLRTALTLLMELDPTHPICVARELTKLHETFHRGTVEEIHTLFQTKEPKGEIVIIIAPKKYIIPNKSV